MFPSILLYLYCNSLIWLPEAACKQQNDGIHFETACNHQNSQDKLRETVEHTEVAGSAHLPQCQTCVGEGTDYRGNCGLHVQVIQGNQNASYEYNSEKQENVHGG